MIITRTPFRVSLFGGGTDYPEWFNEHGGCVVGMAINKYCYVSLRHLPPFFEHKSRIVYSKVETVTDNANIEHPAVRGVLAHLNIAEGVEIHHDADLPARSGLGSSSAFVVGLLQAVRALSRARYLKKTLAQEAIYVERELLHETVGWQDQIWAAVGGLNRIDFKDGAFEVVPLILSVAREKDLTDRLLLVFTGFSRIASEIEKEKLASADKLTLDLKILQQMAVFAGIVLRGPTEPLARLANLLHESWLVKRRMAASVSTLDIDAVYERACFNGALGGKLLGAGGGGFFVFYVEPEDRERLKRAMEPLICVDFEVDHAGSKVVLHQPEGL
jgi:D-glycero-alpha-D-manno-heptose-7-phosphate kinase